MDWRDHIEKNPAVMLGKPIIKGTRLTAEHILEYLSYGSSEADLLQSYPTLRAEHIYAVLAFAADFVRRGERAWTDGPDTDDDLFE